MCCKNGSIRLSYTQNVRIPRRPTLAVRSSLLFEIDEICYRLRTHDEFRYDVKMLI